MRHALIIAALTVTLVGCGKVELGSVTPPAAALLAQHLKNQPAPQSVAELALKAGEGMGAADFEPVYGRDKVTPSETAEALCDAMFTLPAKRRSECCGGGAGRTLVEECGQIVTKALASGWVTIKPERSKACVAALQEKYSTCDWMGLTASQLPPACRAPFEGHRQRGESCRSTLECADGRLCVGTGPTRAGRCGDPREDGSVCGAGADVLVAYTRQSAADLPSECVGYCRSNRCMARAERGAECESTPNCQAGLMCLSKQCVEARQPVAVGKPCAKDRPCADGAHCVEGVCELPRASGSSCTTAAQCAGRCEVAVGQTSGTCAPACPRVKL